MKKKILIVGPSPTKSKGGMATVIAEINNDLTMREKYDIEVFESYIDGNKIKVLLYSAYAFIKFLFTKRGFDIYHIHAASRGSTFRKGLYVDAAKKWNKKVVLHIHGGEFLVFFDEISKGKKDRVVNILKKSDMVIALSEDWKTKFDATFGLTNCCVLENGIDVERLSPAIQDPELHQNAFVVLGRLGKNKGTYDLVEAIAIAKKTVPDIKCYLAGDGDIDQIKELVRFNNLEDNITVVGWADFDKKLQLLQSASTVVLPSYNEGLPMSVLEGMACGKGIISTTVGAIPEVVTADNGILVKPGDITALAEALIAYSTDVTFLRKTASNNIKKIEQQYSMASMHKKLMTYYDEV